MVACFSPSLSWTCMIELVFMNHDKAMAVILRLHGQFCVVSLPYMDNEWSGSERGLLSQRRERANALATSTGRRLVMKCTWSRSRGTRLPPSTDSIQCLCPDKMTAPLF